MSCSEVAMCFLNLFGEVGDTGAALCSYIGLKSLFFFINHAGQPKRHLLTTGWSVFVSAKRLVAGDSVIFIRFYFLCGLYHLLFIFKPYFYLLVLSGMKRINCFWEYVERFVHRR